MKPSIITRSLTKRYGEKAVVDSLDLTVEPGEVFGLLGPNGAGKTTTILMLLGLVEPTTGEMEVLGLDPRHHPLEVKRRVGFLPDAVGFYDTMTGRENLMFTARLNGISDAARRIESLLERVGLAADGDRPTGQYSRGMLQRLGLADALLKDPGVLILDEPTTAIDPEGVADMLALIRSLATDQGVTVLLSSHLLHQVQAVCDRVAIFVSGKVVAQGTPRELAAQQRGPVRVEFRFAGDPAAAAEALARLPYGRGTEPGRLPQTIVAALEADRVAEAVRELATAGIDLTGVRRIDEDLDSIYRRYFEAEVKA